VQTRLKLPPNACRNGLASLAKSRPGDYWYSGDAPPRRDTRTKGGLDEAGAMAPVEDGVVTRLLPADCLAIEEIGASGHHFPLTDVLEIGPERAQQSARGERGEWAGARGRGVREWTAGWRGQICLSDLIRRIVALLRSRRPLQCGTHAICCGQSASPPLARIARHPRHLFVFPSWLWRASPADAAPSS
jgi:hypothetical protein